MVHQLFFFLTSFIQKDTEVGTLRLTWYSPGDLLLFVFPNLFHTFVLCSFPFYPSHIKSSTFKKCKNWSCHKSI